jgi:hypothetical protein
MSMNSLSRVGRKLRELRKYANVRGVVFFAQRRVHRAGPRRRIAGVVARFLPAASTVNAQASPEVKHLQEQGFVMFDGIVTPQMVDDMRRHFTKSELFAGYIDNPRRWTIDSNDLPDSHVLAVTEQGVVSCPHLLDIANHPRILAAVEGAFGCKPTIGFITAWWSIPTADGVARHAENFHRDFDDVSFLKLFVYLNDVEYENGPHEFVRASHLSAKLCGTRRYTDQEVEGAFAPDDFVRFTGKAGTTFLENTTGLHRGLHVRHGRRLILQIVFSMLPMAYGPPAPFRRETFAMPKAAIDPYINRIYVDHS